MSFAHSPAHLCGGAPQRHNRRRCGIHHKIGGTFSGELRAVVRDDGVWNSKAMDDVEKEHSLLGLDRGDRPSFYPLCKFVYGDKQVCVAPGRLL